MPSVRSYVRRIDYFKRHAQDVVPHLTLRKIRNLVFNELEYRRAATTVQSLPPFLKIDPTPRCHLRCPSCVQSNPELKERFNRQPNMTLAQLKHVVEPLSKTLLGISLSLTGEPLLSKELIAMIEYIHSLNIAVSFPTNLSVPLPAEKVERLVRSGLDTMTVSLDGTCAATYEQYRVGGDFDLVLRNVRAIADAKRRLGSRRPTLVWKFILFDHNAHEVETVRRTYRSLGFDSYEFVYDFNGAHNRAMEADHREKMFKRKIPCHWPWNTMVVSWSGRVQPCCYGMTFGLGDTSPDVIDSIQFDLGNTFTDDVVSIWRNSRYRDVRRGYSREHYGEQLHAVCRKCLGVDDGPGRTSAAVCESSSASYRDEISITG